MRKINYKSDFDFILCLKKNIDQTEVYVPFPECDWDVRFWTSNKANVYVASCRGGVYVNCIREEDGRIRFVFDNHRLGIGRLEWEPHFELPNDIYPDNIQDIFDSQQLCIELVAGSGDWPTTAEVEAMLPFIVESMEPQVRQVNEIIDKVNACIDDIFGSPGITTKSSGSYAPPFLQRGVISINAKPGVVYRNVGRIHVPLKRASKVTFDTAGIEYSEIVFVNGVVGSQIKGRQCEIVRHDDGHTVTARLSGDGVGNDTTALNAFCLLYLKVKDCWDNGEGKGYPYIMRDTDGSFVYPRFDRQPVEPPAPEPPDAFMDNPSSASPLEFKRDPQYALEWLLERHDVWIRRRKSLRRVGAKFREPGASNQYEGGESKAFKWMRLKKGAALPCCGILRLRYSGGRKRPSQWAYYSYALPTRGGFVSVVRLG